MNSVLSGSLQSRCTSISLCLYIYLSNGIMWKCDQKFCDLFETQPELGKKRFFLNLILQHIIKDCSEIFSKAIWYRHASVVVWMILFTRFIYWTNLSLIPRGRTVTIFHIVIKQSLQMFNHVPIRTFYHFVCYIV